MTDSRTRILFSFGIYISILAVSTASIFIRFAQINGAPFPLTSASRHTFAALLLLSFVLAKHRDEIKSFTLGEILLGCFSAIFIMA